MKKIKTSGTSGGERKFLVGFICNCATELRLVLTALLLLCSLATLLQFFPARFFLPFYSNTLPACASSPSIVLPDNIPPSPPPPLRPLLDEVVENGVVRRVFNPVGTAAYNFVLMSAYRGGPNTFAIMGLSSKSLHVFGHPIYTCEYQSNNNNNETVTISVRGRKILPDWGYGSVYTTVVVNCTFPENAVAVMNSASGGRLLLHASPNGGYDTRIKTVSDTILALDEPPASWSLSRFVDASPQYDYLYCGSPIYGSLSPQRVREWIAYHVRLFGGRSHFVIHDAGGVHAEVLEVLKPWIDLGYVTLQDIREQERFDSYYHNQFLVVNDCLHRFRFDAKWMFFFDIDEFIYLSSGVDSFETVMDSLTEYTMFSIEQVPMSNQLCLIEDSSEIDKWLGDQQVRVAWSRAIWHPLVVPKHSFFGWMVAHRGLKTKDRLYALGVSSNDSCCLCGMFSETHVHLLSSCCYTLQIIELVNDWLRIRLVGSELLEGIQPRRWSKTQKVVVNSVRLAVVYAVWLQRNEAWQAQCVLLPRIVLMKIQGWVRGRILYSNHGCKLLDTIWLSSIGC